MTDYLETWLDSESAGQSVIAVKTIYIDINDGSLTDGFLFSQIVYWSGKTKEGKYRAQTMFGGHRWIIKEADEWFAECRVKDSTARESLSRIQARGLIVKEVHRFHGKACTHLRINPKVFEARIKLALEGKPMPKLDKKGKVTSEVPGLPKSSKATLPKSSNPYTDTTVSENTPDRVSSYEDTLAQPSQAQVDANPFAALSCEAKDLLNTLKTKALVTRVDPAFKEKAAVELEKAGLVQIDRVGNRSIIFQLVLTEKGKTQGLATCPDDVKVQELQTAIQTAFLPGSNGNEVEEVVTPSPQTPPPDGAFVVEGHYEHEAWIEPGQYTSQRDAINAIQGLIGLGSDIQYRVLDKSSLREIWPLPLSGYEHKAPTPLPHPAPAALPEVPDGYEARWSHNLVSMTDGHAEWSNYRHYIPAGKKRALCGLFPKYDNPDTSRHADNSQDPQEQCPDCAAEAAARPQGKAKASKPDKPTLKQPPTDVKDALALLRHGGKEHMTGANWKALVKLWNQLECPPLESVQKFARWWAQDWRGKNGEHPLHSVIVSEWPTAMHWKDGNAEPEMHYADDGVDFPEIPHDDL